MAKVSFSAAIDAWCAKVPKRAEAVFKKSAERVAEEVKNPVNMPVITGFLRKSLMASTSAMPAIDPKAHPVKGQSYPDNQGEISMVINGASLGDTIYLGFTAAYARHQEYGAQGREGRAFVRLAAQKWPETVAAAVAEAKARVK